MMTVQSIDWQGSLTKSLDDVATFVPKLLAFLVILIIAIFLAKIISKLVGKLLAKVGFDKLLEKAGIGSLTKGSIDPADIITKIVYYGLILIGLEIAVSAFGTGNPLSTEVHNIVAWLPKLVVGIVIVIIAGAVANAVKDLLASSVGHLSYGPLLTKIAGGVIVALGVIAALDQIGVATSVTGPVLIAVLATVGGILVVGFGGGLIGPAAKKWEGWLASINRPNGPTVM
jgi:hypothetical protein